MANIIDAIINLIENPILELKEYYSNRNRANSVGDALEEYVKDLLCDTFDVIDEAQRVKIQSEIFSYLGNNSNPPDMMLKAGDAIEVKKIENFNSALALNSSYPKTKLYADSPMISKACKECEDWDSKDLIYVVGVVNKNQLNSLSFTYGIDYAADKETYEKIKTVIKTGVESIDGVEFSKTKELGRVNKVDPLGITYLRVRGMWGIENPFNVFNYVFKQDNKNKFNFMAIINEEKWATFNNTSNLLAVIEKVPLANISDIEIKDPNNPAKLKSCKLITFTL